MTEAANDIRVANLVERDRFVLKVLDERLFKFGVGCALQRDVERLDDDLIVIMSLVVGDKHFGITAAPEQARHKIAIINNTVFESQFRHSFSIVTAKSTRLNVTHWRCPL